MTPQRKPVSPSTKAAVLHYLQNHKDLPQKRIAKLTGISERSVYRIKQEAGLATTLPRMTTEDVKIKVLLATRSIGYDKLKELTDITRPTAPTKAQLIKSIVDLDDAAWADVLNQAVRGRVAKNANTSVTTAMLNIRNQIDKAASNE